MIVRKDSAALKTLHEIDSKTSTLMQQIARMGDEIDSLKILLDGWLEFSKDVQPGCAAGKDWLDSLRAQTKKVLK